MPSVKRIIPVSEVKPGDFMSTERCLVRGRPVYISGGYGRVISADGGTVTMATPGGTVINAGLTCVRALDSDGVAKLRYYEGLDECPYHGMLTAEEQDVQP